MLKRIVMVVVAACGIASAAQAGKQDFILHNETGVEINELYVSPSRSDNWEDDVLGRDTLPDGESLAIHFDRSEKADLWDIRVVDGAGQSIEWAGLDLSEISAVTLYFKKGRAWAETE